MLQALKTVTIFVEFLEKKLNAHQPNTVDNITVSYIKNNAILVKIKRDYVDNHNI